MYRQGDFGANLYEPHVVILQYHDLSQIDWFTVLNTQDIKNIPATRKTNYNNDQRTVRELNQQEYTVNVTDNKDHDDGKNTFLEQ